MAHYKEFKPVNNVTKQPKKTANTLAVIVIFIVSVCSVLACFFSGYLAIKDFRSKNTAYADEVLTSNSFISSMFFVPATNIFKSTVIDDNVDNLVNYKNNVRWYTNYRTTFFKFYLNFNFVSGSIDNFGIFLLDNYSVDTCRVYDKNHNLLPLSDFDNSYMADFNYITLLPFVSGSSDIYFMGGSQADNFYLGSFTYYFSSSSFGVPQCCEIRIDDGLQVAPNLFFYQTVVNYYDGVDFNTAHLFSIRFTYVTGSFKYFYYLNDRIYYFNNLQDDPTIQYVSGYNNGYNEGYNNGYTEGTDLGYNGGYNIGYNLGYSEGEVIGYNHGVNSANEYTFNNLFASVIDAPVQALTGLLNFNILGVNLYGFFTGLLTLCLILWVIKMILGGA